PDLQASPGFITSVSHHSYQTEFSIMLVDSHCHLDRLNLTPYAGQLTGAIEAAHERGIQQMLCIGISLDNIQTVIDIAQRYPSVVPRLAFIPAMLKKERPVQNN